MSNAVARLDDYASRDDRNEPNRNLRVTGFLLACIMYHRFPIF
jgi:hypothetical protein